MKSLVHSLAALVLIASLHAQNNLPQYSVLRAEKGESFLAKVNQLADQGYRMLTAGKYAVLHLEATPPDTYRYAGFEVHGGPVQVTNWLNEQGAHGYRWVPNIGLLEKSPHPRNYEYRASPRGLGPSKTGNLSAGFLEEGYHPVAPGTEETFFEREVGQSRTSSPPVGAIAVSNAMHVHNVMKRTNELARQGYRFLAPLPSGTCCRSAVMMQKCSDDCAGRYEYRSFDAKNAAQLEHDLNALGSDGFRLLPSMLHRPPHLLERNTREKHSYSYRAIDPPDDASLQRALIAADQENYKPIGFVWHVGWNAQGFLLLEKEITAPSVP